MTSEYIIATVVSILLSANGFILKMFVSNIKELKKVIQELSLAIRGSQKDIEWLNKSVELHEKVLEKHSEEIEELKINQPRAKNNT